MLRRITDGEHFFTIFRYCTGRRKEYSFLRPAIVLHTALARTRWSPHSGFWLIVLGGAKQLYFHFIGLSLRLYPASTVQF